MIRGLLVFTILFGFLCAEEEIALSRRDNIPEDLMDGASDCYLQGYLQAMVNLHYSEYKVVVIVKDHEVWLANLSKNQLIAKSIIAFLKDVPGVKDVKVLEGEAPKEILERENYINRPKVSGIWFPQETELFQPLVAAPRQVTYSIGYRVGDRVAGKSAVAISLGDDFPIFRWLDVGSGDLQIGIESGIWSVFNMNPHPNINGGTALFNTDFYVGIPLTYAYDKWSFRLRGYHLSSHLGDEYMVNHPNVVRLNPSYEAIDFYFSYQGGELWRVYLGPGVILHSDRSFSMKTGYVEYGAELRFWGKKIYYHNLYGNFLLAADFRNWQLNHWQFDGTGVFGYEWSKLQGIGRKIRLLVQYHNGFSLEGQFQKERTSYACFMVNYGF